MSVHALLFIWIKMFIVTSNFVKILQKLNIWKFIQIFIKVCKSRTANTLHYSPSISCSSKRERSTYSQEPLILWQHVNVGKYSHENAMVRALVSICGWKGNIRFIQHGNGKCKKSFSTEYVIKIPLWAHEMNLRVIKNISNQGLHPTFWRKIMMIVSSYGKNQEGQLFRQASQIFRIAAHPLPPHANCA